MFTHVNGEANLFIDWGDQETCSLKLGRGECAASQGNFTIHAAAGQKLKLLGQRAAFGWQLNPKGHDLLT